jgi:hypothetical protein
VLTIDQARAISAQEPLFAAKGMGSPHREAIEIMAAPLKLEKHFEPPPAS